MNSTKFKACFGLIHGLNNLLSCNLSKCRPKCSVAHLQECSHYLKFIPNGSRLMYSTAMEAKQNDSLQSFSSPDLAKVRLKKHKTRIQDVLKCSSTVANNILQHAITYSSFDDQEVFFEKLECLSKAGLDTTLILKNFCLVNDPLDELEKKLEALQSRFKGCKHTALLKLSRDDLEDLMVRLRDDEKNSMKSRIDFLSREFHLSVPEVCELLVERTFLRRKSLAEIVSIYELLLSCGTTSNAIRTDFWVFRFSRKHILERINLAKSYNIDHFRCWMIRCNLRTLERTAEIEKSNKEALDQYPSKESFLLDKLPISEEELRDLYSNNPRIQNISESKLKLMIDFLLSENFTPQQIKSYLTIVLHKRSKIQERIQELRKLNYEFKSLSVLCYNNQMFQKLVSCLQNKEEEKDDSAVKGKS